MLQGTGMGCKVRACAAKSTTRFFSKTFPVSAPPGKQIRWKTTAEMACNDEFGPSSASDRSPPLLARTLLLGMFSGYAGRGRTLLFLTKCPSDSKMNRISLLSPTVAQLDVATRQKDPLNHVLACRVGWQVVPLPPVVGPRGRRVFTAQRCSDLPSLALSSERADARIYVDGEQLTVVRRPQLVPRQFWYSAVMSCDPSFLTSDHDRTKRLRDARSRLGEETSYSGSLFHDSARRSRSLPSSSSHLLSHKSHAMPLTAPEARHPSIAEGLFRERPAKDFP